MTEGRADVILLATVEKTLCHSMSMEMILLLLLLSVIIIVIIMSCDGFLCWETGYVYLDVITGDRHVVYMYMYIVYAWKCVSVVVLSWYEFHCMSVNMCMSIYMSVRVQLYTLIKYLSLRRNKVDICF